MRKISLTLLRINQISSLGDFFVARVFFKHSHWLLSFGVHFVFFVLILNLGRVNIESYESSPVVAQPIKVFATPFSAFQNRVPSANEAYEQALERKISAEQQELEALSRLIAIYESSKDLLSHEDPQPNIDEVPQVIEVSHGVQTFSTTSYEGAPLPLSSLHPASDRTPDEINLEYNDQGFIVSVDPLILYRYRLLKHITDSLPSETISGVCLVNLSLSSNGEILSVAYQEFPRESCFEVKKALNRGVKFPVADDPSIHPYLTGLLVKIGGT